MKQFLLFVLLGFSNGIFAKNVDLELKNSSNTKISVSYQKGFVLNTSNGNNYYIGDINSGEVKLFKDKGIELEKGETIFIVININGSFISVANYRAESTPPKVLRFDIHLPQIKNSDSPMTSQSGLESFLQKFGSTEISDGGRLRAQVNIPLSKGMSTICGGLVVVDMAKLNANKEFKIGDIEYILPSYALKTTPVKIDPQGRTIVEEFDYENDIVVGASSSFPLAGSLNFGFSNANYYKTKIQVKEAGWIPLENPSVKGYVASLGAINDLDSQVSYAIDIKGKLTNCLTCRVYTVEYAFFYESLILTTSKYEKLTGTSDGSVSSVVTLNGSYKRTENKDFSDSRGSTIAYISLTNDVTLSVKNTIENIIQKAYLQEHLDGKTRDLTRLTSKTNKELEELGIKSVTNKSVNIKDYLSSEKIEQFDLLNKDKINNTIKILDRDLK
ncbi:hypothetical protein [Flavobacterium sp. C3NV]|uniref:hypothetical protein n=1 Tax=Flavobacterium sp. C3NV TaxID=3393358 RepID=UPI00399025AC